jgi:hypothetical protein
MRNTQYRELPKSIGRYDEPVEFIVTVGKFKGQRCFMKEKFRGDSVSVELLNNAIREIIPYTSLDILDHLGNPIIVHPSDMTGRPIIPDDWCVFLKKGSIRVGRVVRVTPAGSAIVKSALKNGKKIDDWRNKKPLSLEDLDNILLLPVSNNHLVEWMLKDFENLQLEV